MAGPPAGLNQVGGRPNVERRGVLRPVRSPFPSRPIAGRRGPRHRARGGGPRPLPRRRPVAGRPARRTGPRGRKRGRRVQGAGERPRAREGPGRFLVPRGDRDHGGRAPHRRSSRPAPQGARPLRPRRRASSGEPVRPGVATGGMARLPGPLRRPGARRPRADPGPSPRQARGDPAPVVVVLPGRGVAGQGHVLRPFDRRGRGSPAGGSPSWPVLLARFRRSLPPTRPDPPPCVSSSGRSARRRRRFRSPRRRGWPGRS